jgi:hypothetical protein
LAKALVAYVDAADIDTASNRPWTLAVKSGLHSILSCATTEVIFTDTSAGMSEFLLDVVAWSRSDGEGVVLACECEWGVDAVEVVRDFEKLLVVKSSTKLMIFASSGKKASQEAILKAIRASLLSYKHHIAGERYIFIDFARAPNRLAYWIQIPLEGRLDSLPDETKIPVVPN